MPVRFIGRDPVQKGKTLYEICRQLANSGKGRVVYRQRQADLWPNQKSFYRLTKVIPDKTCIECRKGEAWAIQVHRGVHQGDTKIGSGHKMDWKLVPKHLEEEFCRITDVCPPPKPLPSHIPAPPWLNLLLKKNTSSHSVDDVAMMPLITVKIKLGKGDGRVTSS